MLCKRRFLLTSAAMGLSAALGPGAHAYITTTVQTELEILRCIA
jgi:hypothetical protein